MPDASADAIVSLFGVKTLSDAQCQHLASEIARVLRLGGRFSLIEVSVPRNQWLRRPYLFYLSRVIPILGALLLGHSEEASAHRHRPGIAKSCGRLGFEHE